MHVLKFRPASRPRRRAGRARHRAAPLVEIARKNRFDDESLREMIAHLDRLGELALKLALEEDLQRDRAYAALLKALSPTAIRHP